MNRCNCLMRRFQRVSLTRRTGNHACHEALPLDEEDMGDGADVKLEEAIVDAKPVVWEEEGEVDDDAEEEDFALDNFQNSFDL